MGTAVGVAKMKKSAKHEPATVITRQELSEIADWEKKRAEAARALQDAEKQLYPRRLSLAQKVLGVELEDEYRAMDPEQIEKVALRRFNRGLWELGWGAKAFKFVKTWEGRSVHWKELFIAHAGELAAAKAQADTPKLFSYKVEVEI
jgi:hypothetical protein